MGVSDIQLFDVFAPALSEYVKSLRPGSKVAWLGQQSHNIDHYPRHTLQGACLHDMLLEYIDVDVEHHYYDIVNENRGNSFHWDANESWEDIVCGYDLVLGIRILYACESASNTIRNLKYVVENNKTVVFDFMSGNPQTTGCPGVGRTLWFTKKPGSKHILPIFPEFYPEKWNYGVKPTKDDQIIQLKDLTDAGILVDNKKTYRDTIKGRFYSICELNNAT